MTCMLPIFAFPVPAIKWKDEGNQEKGKKERKTRYLKSYPAKFPSFISRDE